MRLQAESDDEAVQMLRLKFHAGPQRSKRCIVRWKGPQTRYVEYRIVSREVDFNLMCGLRNRATSDSLSTADLSGFPCKHFHTHTQYHTVYSINIWDMIMIHEIVIYLYNNVFSCCTPQGQVGQCLFLVCRSCRQPEPILMAMPMGCGFQYVRWVTDQLQASMLLDRYMIWLCLHTFNFEHVLFCSCVFDRFEALQPSCRAAMVSLATSATTCWCAGWSMKLRNHTRSYK